MTVTFSVCHSGSMASLNKTTTVHGTGAVTEVVMSAHSLHELERQLFEAYQAVSKTIISNSPAPPTSQSNNPVTPLNTLSMTFSQTFRHLWGLR